MAITATSFSIPAKSASVAPKARTSFFSRFVSALKTSREHAAMREIARHQNLVDQVAALRKSDAVTRDVLPF